MKYTIIFCTISNHPFLRRIIIIYFYQANTRPSVANFAPVGAGMVNFKEILTAKDIAGIKYMFVEEDKSREYKPFDDIQTAITNLKTKIMV